MIDKDLKDMWEAIFDLDDKGKIDVIHGLLNIVNAKDVCEFADKPRLKDSPKVTKFWKSAARAFGTFGTFDMKRKEREDGTRV